MGKLDVNAFQHGVSQYLIRHKSILDCLSKSQEANARVNRAVTKAVTSCGCLRVTAGKQKFPEDVSLAHIREYLDSHVSGELCPECKDAVESEMGRTLFYLAALADLLDLSLDQVMEKEFEQVTTLGIFNLT